MLKVFKALFAKFQGARVSKCQGNRSASPLILSTSQDLKNPPKSPQISNSITNPMTTGGRFHYLAAEVICHKNLVH